MRIATGQRGDFGLDAPTRERLIRHSEAAVRRARRAGEGLAAVTVPLEGAGDPAPGGAASGTGGERWFALGRPEADGAAIGGWGWVRAIESSSVDRFRDVARTWRALGADAAADPIDGPAGSGLVAVGGFAFAPDGGTARHWTGFAPASLHVPEVAIVRGSGETRLTVCALAAPDDAPEDLVARVEARLARLRA